MQRGGEVGPHRPTACVRSVFSWSWEEFQRIESQYWAPQHHDSNTSELCGRAPCTSRHTGCKRPWWSNRIVYKQVWESNQTVANDPKRSIRLRLLIDKIQSQRIAHICVTIWINLCANKYFQQLNIWNTMYKYIFVITATITILPLFNSFPS